MFQSLMKNLNIFQMQLNDSNQSFAAQKLANEEIQIPENGNITNLENLLDICHQ